ncbi:MAG: hypothetical protein FJ276_09875, partial [Planctomycetes bacterium]|nr:hypothetical protein [Planctomycetota bacterium]
MDIVLEHVRSFARRCEIPLRPLTLLVGENSTGKSTFLAVAAAVLDRRGFPWSPAFNSPPYSLGNFDTIATYKGGKYGRDQQFTMGIRYDVGEGRSHETIATYANEHGQVILSGFRSCDADITGELSLDQNRFRFEVCQTTDGAAPLRADFEGELPGAVSRDTMLGFTIWNQVLEASREKEFAKQPAFLRRVHEVLEVG